MDSLNSDTEFWRTQSSLFQHLRSNHGNAEYISEIGENDGDEEQPLVECQDLISFVLFADGALKTVSSKLASDSQNISINGYDSVGVVGQGAFSTVSRSLSMCALKKQLVRFSHTGMPNNTAAMKALIREVNISTHENLYDHPNVVRLIGISWMEEEESDEVHGSTYPYRPILHVELAVQGDLRQFLLHQRDCLPLSEKMRICHEVSMGLKALHDCDIVHGDIKCDNILICQDSSSPNEFTAKICDFSHSIPPYAEDFTLPGGTRPWNAPEWRLPLRSRLSLKATDVYSLGLLFWQVLCDGKDPFGLDSREASSEFVYVDSGLAAKLDHIEAIKRRGNELLDIALRWASRQSFIASDKDKIIRLFEATLPYDAILRDLRKVLFIFDHSFHQPEILSLKFQSPTHEDVDGSTNEHCDFTWYNQYHQGTGNKPLAVFFSEILQNVAQDVGQPRSLRVIAAHMLFHAYIRGFGVGHGVKEALHWLTESARMSVDEAPDGNQNTTEYTHLSHLLRAGEIEKAHKTYGQSAPTCVRPEWLTRAVFYTASLRSLASARHMSENTAEALACFAARYAGIAPHISGAMDELGLSELKQIVMQRLPQTSQANKLADWLDKNKQQVDEIVISNRLDRLVHLFASSGKIELLQMLRQKFQADLNLVNAFGETPLLLACRYGHKHVTKYFLRQGAYAKLPGVESLLIWLASFENDDIPTIAHDLIEAGAQVNLDDEECGSPLLIAVECCNITAVETLLNAGAYVFPPDDEVGSSSCLRAAQQHQPEILDLLLSYDHSKLRRQNLHKTLLLASIQSAGHRDLAHFRFNHCGRPYDRCADALLKVLRKYGADLDDLEWSSILQHAVADGDVPMVSFLLKNHRQRRLGDQKHTNAALFYSIEANHFRFVQLLLDHGADALAGPEIVNCHVMQLVALHGRGEQGVLICEELLRRGLAVDGTFAADARTPLSIAVQQGSLEVAEILLKYGANADAIDSDGLTVLGALLASRDILGNEDTSKDKLARLRFILGPFNTFPKRPAFIVSPEKGRGPLHIAALCTLNGASFINLLLAAFDDQKYINFVDFDGASALHIAVSVGNQAVVKLLLDRGIDSSLVGKNGFTALDLAEKAKLIPVVELLMG